jgi:hypothetical protein
MLLFILTLLFLALDAGYFIWLSQHPEYQKGSSAFAKFTPGAIISEMRGKVAATVYTKNKAGASIRNRTTPINRRSTGQTQKRQQLSSLSSLWRGLTASQIAGWNSAAASFPQQDSLGQTIFLTGAQLYIRCNANLILIGQAAISDAPTPASFAVLALGALTMDASSGTATLAFTPTPVPTGFSLVVRATRPVSAGKSFVGSSEFRFVQVVAAAGTSPVNIAAAYIAIFGVITGSAGQKVFVEAFLMEDVSGLAGIPVRTSALIVA